MSSTLAVRFSTFFSATFIAVVINYSFPSKTPAYVSTLFTELTEATNVPKY